MVVPLGTYSFAANIMSGQASAVSSSYPGQTGAPASSAPSTTPGKARKQAQAQRTRLVALSKHLMTRLQYATFKVEHGWAKQSLSEVENLYYRQNEGSEAHRGGVKLGGGSSASPSNAAAAAAEAPATPTVIHPTSISPRLFKDAAALKRPESDGGDVFGGYGLATPPASGGTHPSSYSAGSKAGGTQGRSASSTSLSPSGPQASGLAEAYSSKRSSPRGSAPSSASRMSASTRTRPATSTTTPTVAALGSSNHNGVTSYADFWSRVGTSSASTSAPAVPRSSGRATASDPERASTTLAGVKRSADAVQNGFDGSSGREHAGSRAVPTSLSTSSSATMLNEASGGSPLKRVRLDLSPAKKQQQQQQGGSLHASPLPERGPSFAASGAMLYGARSATGYAAAGLPRLGRNDSPTPDARP